MKRANVVDRTTVSGGIGVPPVNVIWADGDYEAWTKGVNPGEVYVDESHGAPVFKVLMKDISEQTKES